MIKHEDCTCIDGKRWNNADPTSGQLHECTDCDFNSSSNQYCDHCEKILLESEECIIRYAGGRGKEYFICMACSGN